MNKMTTDFNKLKENYEDGDICVTNARGFWEKAPSSPFLWLNVKKHKLIKKKDVDILNAFLDGKDISYIEPCHKHWGNQAYSKINNFVEDYCPLCKYKIKS